MAASADFVENWIRNSLAYALSERTCSKDSTNLPAFPAHHCQKEFSNFEIQRLKKLSSSSFQTKHSTNQYTDQTRPKSLPKVTYISPNKKVLRTLPKEASLQAIRNSITKFTAFVDLGQPIKVQNSGEKSGNCFQFLIPVYPLTETQGTNSTHTQINWYKVKRKTNTTSYVMSPPPVEGVGENCSIAEEKNENNNSQDSTHKLLEGREENTTQPSTSNLDEDKEHSIDLENPNAGLSPDEATAFDELSEQLKELTKENSVCASYGDGSLLDSEATANADMFNSEVGGTESISSSESTNDMASTNSEPCKKKKSRRDHTGLSGAYWSDSGNSETISTYGRPIRQTKIIAKMKIGQTNSDQTRVPPVENQNFRNRKPVKRSSTMEEPQPQNACRDDVFLKPTSKSKKIIMSNEKQHSPICHDNLTLENALEVVLCIPQELNPSSYNRIKNIHETLQQNRIANKEMLSRRCNYYQRAESSPSTSLSSSVSNDGAPNLSSRFTSESSEEPKASCSNTKTNSSMHDNTLVTHENELESNKEGEVTGDNCTTARLLGEKVNGGVMVTDTSSNKVSTATTQRQDTVEVSAKKKNENTCKSPSIEVVDLSESHGNVTAPVNGCGKLECLIKCTCACPSKASKPDAMNIIEPTTAVPRSLSSHTSSQNDETEIQCHVTLKCRKKRKIMCGHGCQENSDSTSVCTIIEDMAFHQRCNTNTKQLKSPQPMSVVGESTQDQNSTASVVVGKQASQFFPDKNGLIQAEKELASADAIQGSSCSKPVGPKHASNLPPPLEMELETPSNLEVSSSEESDQFQGPSGSAYEKTQNKSLKCAGPKRGETQQNKQTHEKNQPETARNEWVKTAEQQSGPTENPSMSCTFLWQGSDYSRAPSGITNAFEKGLQMTMDAWVTATQIGSSFPGTCTEGEKDNTETDDHLDELMSESTSNPITSGEDNSIARSGECDESQPLSKSPVEQNAEMPDMIFSEFNVAKSVALPKVLPKHLKLQNPANFQLPDERCIMTNIFYFLDENQLVQRLQPCEIFSDTMPKEFGSLYILDLQRGNWINPFIENFPPEKGTELLIPKLKFPVEHYPYPFVNIGGDATVNYIINANNQVLGVLLLKETNYPPNAMLCCSNEFTICTYPWLTLRKPPIGMKWLFYELSRDILDMNRIWLLEIGCGLDVQQLMRQLRGEGLNRMIKIHFRSCHQKSVNGPDFVYISPLLPKILFYGPVANDSIINDPKLALDYVKWYEHEVGKNGGGYICLRQSNNACIS